jgi:hypothetical protein
MIEPMFGNAKFNRGIDRFTATHNLLKLHTHQLAITTP